jgi:hypothetical protein
MSSWESVAAPEDLAGAFPTIRDDVKSGLTEDEDPGVSGCTNASSKGAKVSAKGTDAKTCFRASYVKVSTKGTYAKTCSKGQLGEGLLRGQLRKDLLQAAKARGRPESHCFVSMEAV